MGQRLSCQDAAAPHQTAELRGPQPLLVRQHGAVVKPRGRQRVKVPKRWGSTGGVSSLPSESVQIYDDM